MHLSQTWTNISLSAVGLITTYQLNPVGGGAVSLNVETKQNIMPFAYNTTLF